MHLADKRSVMTDRVSASTPELCSAHMTDQRVQLPGSLTVSAWGESNFESVEETCAGVKSSQAQNVSQTRRS